MTPFIDRIGPLFDYPEDGEPVLLEGWHVNVTPEVLAARPELDAFVVTPSRLRCVWAGDTPSAPIITVALRFADEDEAIAILGPVEP